MEIIIKSPTLDETKRILAALPFLLNPKVKDSYEEWLTDWDVYKENTVYHLVNGIISKYGNVKWAKRENIKVISLNEYLAKINHPWLKIGETT